MVIFYHACVHLACACNRAGSLVSGVCARDADGRVLPGDCSCKANTQGRLCDMCKPGFFNLTADNEQGCQREWGRGWD